MKGHVLCAIAGLGLVGASGLLFAQQEPAQPPPAPSQPAADVSDADIEKFAEIYVDIEATRSEMSQEMAEVQDEQEAQELQARMHEEIVSTIEDHGWSLERYNEVANAISADPELRKQVIDLINETSTG